jgi:hypothetical protein
MEERDPLLSQAYREAAHPEPSPALDARILAAARQAVARPVRRRAAWLNWAVPLSTTAVLVLGITLLFNIQREAPEALREAVPSPASPAPARRESALSLPPTSPPGTRAESAAQPAPAAKASRDADAAASSGAARGAMKPTPAGPASGPVPAPGALPPLAPGQNAASAPAAESSAGAAPEPRPFPAPAAPALQAPPTPPAAGLSSQDSARMERPAPPAAAFAREAAPAFSQGMGKLKAASPEREGPEQWVESIRRLLREGRTDEARKSLEELRKHYPGYGLPEDLRGLAGK